MGCGASSEAGGGGGGAKPVSSRWRDELVALYAKHGMDTNGGKLPLPLGQYLSIDAALKKWKGEEVQLLKELKDKLKNHVKNEVAVADACEVKRQPEVEEVAPEVVCRQVLLARKLEEMNEHQAAKAKSLVDRDKDKEAAKAKAKEEAKAAAKAMAAKTLAANPVFIGEAGTPEEVNPDGFTDPGARAMYLQARAG